MKNTKQLVLCALFIALSFIGAQLKVFGTIAFDSLPAFLGTLALGPAAGALIGFLGHLLTALTSGFPYGIVIHLIIAVFMAITMVVFFIMNAFMERRGAHWIFCVTVSSLLAAAINGPLQLVFLVPLLGSEVCAALAAPLFTVALVNCALGSLVYEALLRAKVISRRSVVNAD